MPTYNGSITGFAVGDDIEVRRNVIGVPAGQTLTHAWLSVKPSRLDPDSAIVLEKAITATDDPGKGQIMDAGESGTAIVRFDLTSADTALLMAAVNYSYAIKVKTSAGKTYTPEIGTIKGHVRISATSA